jgi:hypothetical protein
MVPGSHLSHFFQGVEFGSKIVPVGGKTVKLQVKTCQPIKGIVRR